VSAAAALGTPNQRYFWPLLRSRHRACHCTHSLAHCHWEHSQGCRDRGPVARHCRVGDACSMLAERDEPHVLCLSGMSRAWACLGHGYPGYDTHAHCKRRRFPPQQLTQCTRGDGNDQTCFHTCSKLVDTSAWITVTRSRLNERVRRDRVRNERRLVQARDEGEHERQPPRCAGEQHSASVALLVTCGSLLPAAHAGGCKHTMHL